MNRHNSVVFVKSLTLIGSRVLTLNRRRRLHKLIGEGGVDPANRSEAAMVLTWIALVIALAVAAALFRLILFQGPILEPTGLPAGGIVDVHCHCAGIGAGNSGCFISGAMRRSWKYSFYLKGFDLTEEELESHGDALCIERIARKVSESERASGAVILAMDGVIGKDGGLDRERTIFYVANEFVAAETSRQNHLHFGASVNPKRHDAVQRLQWCFEHDAKLVKWLPSIQEIDPSDRYFEAFYRKLVELDLPLLSHAGKEESFTPAIDELADPEKLRFPLRLGVRVIAAHVGSAGRNEGQANIERTLALMDEFPNLWADISALTQLNRKRFLPPALGHPEARGRLLYGSDYPLIDMPVVSPWFLPMRLTLRQMRTIARIENPWDRDVALKQALGVPRQVFENPARLLGIS